MAVNKKWDERMIEVVNEIAAVPTNHMDRPLEEQKIETMTVDTFGESYSEPEKM